jgi:hypothetical protein
LGSLSGNYQRCVALTVCGIHVAVLDEKIEQILALKPAGETKGGGLIWQSGGCVVRNKRSI